MTPSEKNFKYYAFISYRHTDAWAAKWLQKLLETYTLPSVARKIVENAPKKMRVFRDTTELTCGVLSEELHRNLEESKYLIVICSPKSAQSEYVGDEIAYFRSIGREKYIIPFIISGVPHKKENDCFHPQLTMGGLELLGINVQSENSRFLPVRFHKAFIRLVARLFELDYGTLWNRRKHLLYKLAAFFVSVIAIIIGLIIYSVKSQPFNTEITLIPNEINVESNNLPIGPCDSLWVEFSPRAIRGYKLDSLSKTILVENIPGHYKGKEVKVKSMITGFLPLDSIIILDKNINLLLKRNTTYYGEISVVIYDNDCIPLSDVIVDFGFQTAVSDNNGEIHIVIPLKYQNTIYPISITYHGAVMHNTEGEDVLTPCLGNNNGTALYIK